MRSEHRGLHFKGLLGRMRSCMEGTQAVPGT